jgi:hypothetical protein
MRRIAPLLTLITLWCVATPAAHAWTEPPADDDVRLALFLPIARAAWPGSPCAGREAVHIQADTLLRAEAPLVTGDGNSMLDGMAAPETCEIWMAGDLSALTFCSVLVHEFGHLAGREHTDTPGDVMNGEGDVDWEPCERAVTPPASVRMMQELRSVLPAPRSSWRVSCGARRGAERRCVARRGTRVRRYVVAQTHDAFTVASAD